MTLSKSHMNDVERIRQHLEKEIILLEPQLLDSFPIEAYIAELDRYEKIQGYRFVPKKNRSECEEIKIRAGLRGLELYHKLTLITLIDRYNEREKKYSIPNSIKSIIPREFNRIVSGIKLVDKEGYYVHENDLFSKDLGLCRLKLLPCGSEVLDLWPKIPKKGLLRGGILQIVREVYFIFNRLGGFKPLYESHWDRRLIREFNQRDYDLCYLRIAELLELNPKVKGMFGSSWWFDRQLEIIAPELVFLRKIPEENGARIFFLGTDEHAVRDAIKFSKKRRALYESGKFLPARYMLVWARNDMLDWAERFRATKRKTNEPLKQLD